MQLIAPQVKCRSFTRMDRVECGVPNKNKAVPNTTRFVELHVVGTEENEVAVQEAQTQALTQIRDEEMRSRIVKSSVKEIVASWHPGHQPNRYKALASKLTQFVAAG